MLGSGHGDNAWHVCRIDPRLQNGVDFPAK
jgi:hypothetical protein